MRKTPRTIFITKKLRLPLVLCLILVLTCVLHSKTGAYSVYYNAVNRNLPIYSVEREDKKIAITFDCAWGAEKTQGLLDCMKDYGVECTFFMTQFWVEKYPDMVRKIYEAGHDVGTHSVTHSYMSKMSEDKIVSELSSSSLAIEKITGSKVNLFRAPYGDYNDKLINTCEKEGFFVIQWDVDSLDWKDVTSKQITDRIINKTKNGSIILCHNNAENTLEALPHIFANLQGRGYEFVKLSKLIYTENYTIDNNGRQKLNVNY